MEIVKTTENLEPLNQNIKDDFYIVPNLSFNIEKDNYMELLTHEGYQLK